MLLFKLSEAIIEQFLWMNRAPQLHSQRHRYLDLNYCKWTPRKLNILKIWAYVVRRLKMAAIRSYSSLWSYSNASGVLHIGIQASNRSQDMFEWSKFGEKNETLLSPNEHAIPNSNENIQCMLPLTSFIVFYYYVSRIVHHTFWIFIVFILPTFSPNWFAGGFKNKYVFSMQIEFTLKCVEKSKMYLLPE